MDRQKVNEAKLSLYESAVKVVELLDHRKIQKENLTTRIIRDYVHLQRRHWGLVAESNKLRDALKRILKEPYGCAFCDSGKLRSHCIYCEVSFDDWPYPRQINGICMECHRERGTTWGLLDMLNEEAQLEGQ